MEGGGLIDSVSPLLHASNMRFLIPFAVLLLPGFPALAGTKTQVVHYGVTGNTAPEIYTNIKTSAPKVAANATFAFTLPFTKTVEKTSLSNGKCSYASFKTSSIFQIVVPKLVPGGKAPAAVRKQFGGFSQYLVEHEKWHVNNWTTCLADYDREALKLSAKDCKALDKKKEKLFTSIKKKCVAKDEAFDFYFRKDVLKHPFIVSAQKKK
jgi:predicted secreted Zn-dependent protease